MYCSFYITLANNKTINLNGLRMLTFVELYSVTSMINATPIYIPAITGSAANPLALNSPKFDPAVAKFS